MINQDFFKALEELERQKGITADEFVAALENALTIAYKKNSGENGYVQVKLNPEKNSIKFYHIRNVVEEITDPERDILLEDAREIKKTVKVGDALSLEIVSKEFGRIAAQNAKQVLLQKLREIEHENTEESESSVSSILVNLTVSCLFTRTSTPSAQ